MAKSIRQQILISGSADRGLFVTRLLAEAAIARGLPVFTCEPRHGSARRDGRVAFESRGVFQPADPGWASRRHAGIEIENLAQHGVFLKPGGWRSSMPA